MTTKPKSTQEQIAAIGDRIQTNLTEAKAIMATAEDEGRSLLEDEQARVDEILGPPGSEGEGIVAKLEADRARWQSFQVRADDLSTQIDAQRQNELRGAMVSAGNSEGAQATGGLSLDGMVGGRFCLGSLKRVVVPAEARRYRNLGPFPNEETAYTCGKWLLATVFDCEQSAQWCRDKGIGLQQEIGTPAKGGYLVPTELERAIIEIREQHGIMRRHARIYAMGAETRDVNKHVKGLTAAPVGERQEIPHDDKEWTQVNLVARKWGVITRVSSELSEDAIIDLATDLARDMGMAFAFSEDNAGFNGDGGAGFNSITGVKAALLAGSTYVATGKQAFSALEPIDFETLIGMIPNVPGLMPYWYIHKSAHSQSILRLKQAAGGNAIVDLEQGEILRRGDADFFYLGYPGRYLNVGVSSADQGASVAGAVYFGDLRAGVAFGDRRGVTVRYSEDRYFETDELAVKGTERFDIQVHETGTASKSGTIAMLTFGA